MFVFALIPTVRKAKNEKLEKKVYTLTEDIDSFYTIEQELPVRLSVCISKNSETIKKDVRQKVKIRPLSSYAKPSVFASELNKH